MEVEMSFLMGGRAGRPARSTSGPRAVKDSLAKSPYVPALKDMLSRREGGERAKILGVSMRHRDDRRAASSCFPCTAALEPAQQNGMHLHLPANVLRALYKPCPHLYPPRLPSSMSCPVRIICRQRHSKPQESMW